MILLGVNVDHVATLRQARRTYEPDPVWAAAACVLGGADSITVHLREDRRHIQDRDVEVLRETAAVPLNLEMACAPEIVDLAVRLKPQQVTLVPEKREEVTTEGGLDIRQQLVALEPVIGRLVEAEIPVSLFLDPDLKQLEAAFGLPIHAIELHTGSYANSSGAAQQEQLEHLKVAGAAIRDRGIQLHAGHGLNYHNTNSVCKIPEMRELNIGHAIVARSVFVGLENAVREMKQVIDRAS